MGIFACGLTWTSSPSPVWAPLAPNTLAGPCHFALSLVKAFWKYFQDHTGLGLEIGQESARDEWPFGWNRSKCFRICALAFGSDEAPDREDWRGKPLPSLWRTGRKSGAWWQIIWGITERLPLWSCHWSFTKLSEGERHTKSQVTFSRVRRWMHQVSTLVGGVGAGERVQVRKQERVEIQSQTQTRLEHRMILSVLYRWFVFVVVVVFPSCSTWPCEGAMCWALPGTKRCVCGICTAVFACSPCVGILKVKPPRTGWLPPYCIRDASFNPPRSKVLHWIFLVFGGWVNGGRKLVWVAESFCGSLVQWKQKQKQNKSKDKQTGWTTQNRMENKLKAREFSLSHSIIVFAVVYCCQFDEEKVVSGSGDGLVKIWNLRTGENTHTMRKHAGEVVRKAQSTFHSLGKTDCTFCRRPHASKLSLVHKGLAKRGHIVAATLLTWSCFPNVSSFCHARSICVRHKFCVLDTKNVSENLQKHFLCPRSAQQCCLVLPRTGNIAWHDVAATMCPRFAGA